jgi:hypothetical protein
MEASGLRIPSAKTDLAFPAVLILTQDPSDLVSRVNSIGWESALFQPIFRPCRARRQEAAVKTRIAVAFPARVDYRSPVSGENH